MKTVSEPFFHKGKWYFEGQPIKGAAATKAKSLGVLIEYDISHKMEAGAPENKSSNEDKIQGK